MTTPGIVGLNFCKSQVYTTIEYFLSMVETQFKIKVIMVRTDNGTEFIQSLCLSLFGLKGILHQRAIVKTPQQNGVVKRNHRHLLDTARAIRFQAGFLKHFWGECVLATTHIINKLPMANLHWKSPFEVLNGLVPNLEDLRTTGCLCYAASIGEADKFEARAKKCVLLRYTFGFKGYKLYDLDTRKVFHSRDVIFQENIFPFNDQLQSTATDMSDSSFLWPHIDTANDLDSASIPAVNHPLSSQTQRSVDTIESLQIFDLLPSDLSVPSPHCSTDDHLQDQTETATLAVPDNRSRAET